MNEAYQTGLRITPGQWAQMKEHVEQQSPEEACGLIAGVDSLAHEVIAVTNALHSPVRFRMDKLEQFNAFQHIEAQGWDLLAIYHSHPRGPEGPSATDIAEAYYPEALQLIWSRTGGVWLCRCFRIAGGRVSEIPLHIGNPE